DAGQSGGPGQGALYAARKVDRGRSFSPRYREKSHRGLVFAGGRVDRLALDNARRSRADLPAQIAAARRPSDERLAVRHESCNSYCNNAANTLYVTNRKTSECFTKLPCGAYPSTKSDRKDSASEGVWCKGRDR